MFSTAAPPGDAASPPSPPAPRALPAEHRADVTELGMGLPLTRLYARYLGGSFNVMSVPGVGTSTSTSAGTGTGF